MNISYDEYIQMIPKETANFVNFTLKLFDNYIIEDYSIVIPAASNIVIDDKESKTFACLIFASHYLGNNSKFILSQLGIKESFINHFKTKDYENYNIDYPDVFGKVAKIFLPFIYIENYLVLTPESIIYEYHKNFKDKIKLQNIFEKPTWHMVFDDDYLKYVNQRYDELELQIELDFYKDLPYELISYLNKVSEAFRFFENYLSNNKVYNHDIIRSYDDIAVASLLLSIYYWEDNKVLKYFEIMGLNRDNCKSTLIPNCNLENYPNLPKGLILLKFFKKFLDDGINKDVNKKDLTIEKVIGNIFDRNFTNSLVLETVLHNARLSISDFDNFESKIKSFEQEYKSIENKNKLDKFFDNISNQTIEFVEFVSKIHQFIKMNMNKKGQKYVNNEQDIAVLSFFISSYFVSNDFICYFKQNGITQEKIMTSLGINIKKEELNQIETDIDLIINNYTDIVFGYTSDRKKININTILFSLGNSQKIKSGVILKLVQDINSDFRISDNFTKVVIDYNENQEKIRKYLLEQKFFGDMQEESINFIKNVSQTYQSLENSNNTMQFTKDDLIEIAIYYTTVEYYSDISEIKFLGTLKKKSIGNLLNINRDTISKYDFNIDIIYNLFGKYVFGGKNKNKNKCDITIKDMYTNIFNKDINNSIVLYMFLDDIGFDYKKFINFDESFTEYTNQTIIKEFQTKISESALEYYKNVSQIYKNLLNLAKNDKLIYNTQNIDEIKKASCLLSMFINKQDYFKNRMQLLSKRGITLESYLQYLNIDVDDFNKYQNEEEDYLLINKEFKGCIFPYIDLINKYLFKKHDNGYLYESFIVFLNQSPKIIEEEMLTGKEVVIPLSRDEQINYFTTIPIDTIEYNPTSISRFGIGLSDHSLMIANEFINIAINDDNEKLLNIQDELNKLKRKPSIFSRKKTMSEKIANNKAILDNLNATLKENEERMIEVIDHFGYLKKLIASYVYRLDKYIRVVEKAIHDFNDVIPNKQNGLDNIDNQTILQALHDKLNDYQTSLMISVAQYQKISLLLNTYFINLNKTSNARNTVIPNLYIELSIRDSIILEQESIADLNSINDLLDSIVKTNNQILDKSTFQIKGKNAEIPKELIESIRNELQNQDLISADNSDNMDSSSKQILKKQ